MRVLVIGGTGFLGARLLRRLAATGHQVSAVALDPGSASRHPVITGDRMDPQVLIRAAASSPEVVVDLIAYRPAHTSAVLDSIRDARVVHLSTIAVYAHTPQTPQPAAPARVPTGSLSYASQKADCERVLEAAGVPAVVVRSAPVIGPGDPASREIAIARRLRAAHLVRIPGPLDGRALMVYVDDLVDVLCAAVELEVHRPVAYHLVAPDPPSVCEHVHAIARWCGVTDPTIVAVSAHQVASRGMSVYGFPYPLASPATFDCSRAATDLGFRPTSYPTALDAALRPLRGEGTPRMPAWPGRAAAQASLAGTHDLLHEDRQRWWSRPADLHAVSSAAQLLDALVRPGGDITATSAASWDAAAPLPPPTGRPAKTVIVPATMQPHLRGSPDDRPHPTHQLLGVLQPTGMPNQLRVHPQLPPRWQQEYGHHTPVTTLRVLTPDELPQQPPAVDELVLLTAPSDGPPPLLTVAVWSRVFAVEDPFAALGEIARLLLATDVDAAVTPDLLLSDPQRIVATAASEHFIATRHTPRLFGVPAIVAGAALLRWTDRHTATVSAATTAARLNVPHPEAETAWKAVCDLEQLLFTS